MHCLEIVLGSEIAQPMTITRIGLKSSSSDETTNYNLQIHAGITDYQAVVPVFDENYISGSRQLVFQADTIVLSAQAGDWFFIEFDEPFVYDGQHNLILEFESENTGNAFYPFAWVSYESRTLVAYGGSTSGDESNECNHMILSDDVQDLHACTWGSVKHDMSRH